MSTDKQKVRHDMATKWEYKVVYVAGWKRVSIEGEETYPEEGERTSGFARRFLNGMGADGWELVSTFDQNWYQGGTKNAILILKRPIG